MVSPTASTAVFVSARARVHQFCDLVYTNSVSANFFALLDGRDRLPDPPQAKASSPVGSQTPCDLLWSASTALLLRPRAVEALEPVLQDGVLLKLRGGRDQIYAFCPRHFSDALDLAASSVRRFPSGRILEIEHYEFDPERLEGIDVFKLDAYPRGPMLFGQRFVDVATKNGLTGLDFIKVFPTNAI